MTRRTLSTDDVNGLFLYQGKVYRMISYCGQPTVSFERVGGDRGSRIGGAVGSPLVEEFVRLVPEGGE